MKKNNELTKIDVKESINNFFNSVTDFATNPDLYWHIAFLIFCFIAYYIIYLLSKKFIFTKKNNFVAKNKKFNALLGSKVMPLMNNLIATFFLIIFLIIYEVNFESISLVTAIIKTFILIILLKFVKSTSKTNFTATTLGFFLIPSVILNSFGLLKKLTFYLDDYGFKFGSYKISVYLFIKAFIILIFLIWLANLIAKKTKYLISNSAEMEEGTKNILLKFTDIILYSIAFLIILRSFGIDLTAFAVIGGALGVGLGFGLQKIASNFVSGIILLFENTIHIGDLVELNDGKISGFVRKFGARYTLIESWDSKEILIPNEEFIINRVNNWTYSDKLARIEIKLRVGYETDMELVKEILINCATADKRIITDPAPSCYIREFGDYGIDYLLYMWSADITEGSFSITNDTLVRIWNEFKARGINIAFPKQLVELKK